VLAGPLRLAGVNSTLARQMKNIVPKLDKLKKDVQLFLVGDKVGAPKQL
jgi:hypothetical protein